MIVICLSVVDKYAHDKYNALDNVHDKYARDKYAHDKYARAHAKIMISAHPIDGSGSHKQSQVVKI